MSIDTIIPADLMAELQDAADKAFKGIRDPDAMRRAAEEMDQMREDLRKRIGTVDVAVDLVRDARNKCQ